ncbi:MAG TPA: phosphoribosylformylglycinamidine cyclo-ligase [Gammaproteobacteria bacterium]|nr:phosphoribosylformylglycinamidine cyclo-ligase [Gammaproteobacteria bacterium]
MTSRPDKELTYKAAGVDIDAGEALVERIGPAVAATRRPEVIGGLGGFGGLFRVPSGYRSPVLVSGTDGVGTKLKLAIDYDAHDTIGIDLVAMCANDVVVSGAEPMFFLDYYVTPKLDVDTAARVVAGIAAGCKLAGASLIGGETAEHPGMHAPGEYDLAGFCVGIVEEDSIISGRDIVAGDSVIGLASSGPHSNGYSLIRKVLAQRPEDAEMPIGGRRLIELLLEPTRIYVRSVLRAHRAHGLKGIAHITGGGLIENIPRVLPDGLGVVLERGRWEASPVFDWLEDAGVATPEMHRSFNCGIGMVVIVDAAKVDDVVAELEREGETAMPIGSVVETSGPRVEIV